MENLVWLLDNFIYGGISAENDDDLRKALAARLELSIAGREYSALLTRHNALVEAVAWERECDACPLKNTTEAEKHGFAAIWATRRAARAEVDRILSEEK